MKADKKQNTIKKIPVVTILGHVDHGKTSLLDQIRKAKVHEQEIGGITQKISVFTVDTKGDGSEFLTFIDTPGHEAFDLMRNRGGAIADIVLLIVAADDGVMPQTKESINIIKNSEVKPIVVINKCDLPSADIPRIKRELANEGILVEGMGGQVPVLEVSAKNGTGVKELLDMIHLVVEIENLDKVTEEDQGIIAKAYVLESVKSRSQGYVSTVVVDYGTLKKGDVLAYKSNGKVITEKVKGFISEDSQNIEKLSQGYGGKIIGLSSLLELGAEIYTLNNAKSPLLKTLFVEPVVDAPLESQSIADVIDLESFFSGATEKAEAKKTLKIIIKAGSEGSLEAIKKSLSALDVDGFKPEIVKAEVGNVTLKDLDTADVTKAIVLAFEVMVEQGVDSLAERKKILLRKYDIIYKLVEEVEDVLAMMAQPEEEEEEIGSAEVRQIFVLTNGSKVIGCRVKEGMIKRGCKCYIVRNDEIISEGKIISLRNQKNEINEAKNGQDMGAIIEPVPDAQEGDELHCFKVIK